MREQASAWSALRGRGWLEGAVGDGIGDARSGADDPSMIFRMKRLEVQVLLRAGHQQAAVAEIAGISERSVRRIAGEEAVDDVDDDRERSRRGIGRPGKASDFEAFVRDALKSEPHLKGVELFRRARGKGYTGRKSAFYELVRRVRPRRMRVGMRFEGLAAEFSQHDFGHVDVSYDGGGQERIHFFASRLKYSRLVAVTIVANEKAETLIRTLADHFEVFGGVPLCAVFDRPKTVALKWKRNGEVTEWNPVFAMAAMEIGFTAEVCWPYQPQQKGSVENLVGWVKGSFFKQRRFADYEDLLEQLAEWQREVNDETPCRATGVSPRALWARDEQGRLAERPARVRPEDLALRIPAQVGPTAEVVHDTHPYSMPPESAGFPATIYLYRDRLRIVAGRYEATHPRQFQPGEVSRLPEHRAAHLASISGKRGKRYLKRQHLLEVGAAALAFITELVHRKPKTWSREVDDLHDLLQRCGPVPLERALQIAVDQEEISADFVARVLRSPRDQGPMERRP